MFFYSRLLILFLFFYSANSNAENLNLLVLPLSDGTSYVYSVDLKKPCSFAGVLEVNSTKLKLGKRDNWFIGNLNLLQNRINFKMIELILHDDFIEFSLSGATNLKFKFLLEKENKCRLKKILYFNDSIYSLDQIYIDYSSVFFSPVIKKIIIKNNGIDKNLLLHPWALQGMISSYELNAGLAVKTYSNIRKSPKAIDRNSNIKAELLPAFIFRYGPIFLSKDGIGSLLFNAGEFSFLAMAIIEGEPYEAAEFNERKRAIYLGSIVKFNLLEFIYYNDFFKEKGYNLKLNLAPEFYFNTDLKFKPQVFIQYWDKKYVDYYFGLSPNKLNQAVNYGTVFEIMHFKGRWTYLLNLGVKFYGREVYSSPSVVRANEIQVVTSLLYKFL